MEEGPLEVEEQYMEEGPLEVAEHNMEDGLLEVEADDMEQGLLQAAALTYVHLRALATVNYLVCSLLLA